MNNTINTKNGIFTINSVPKNYKIEKYDEYFNILIVEYSSNSIVLEDEKQN
jgi:hypothetical protein